MGWFGGIWAVLGNFGRFWGILGPVPVDLGTPRAFWGMHGLGLDNFGVVLGCLSFLGVSELVFWGVCSILGVVCWNLGGFGVF